jgi:FHA domain
VRVRLDDIKDRINAVRTFLDPPLGPDAQPLDIRAAVVDAVESRIAVLDIGRIVFPYNHIVVRLIAGPGRDKALLDLAFAELERKVRERLRERRCEVPYALRTTVSIEDQPPSDWAPGQLFSIDCERADTQEPKSDPVWPLVILEVLKGSATQAAYSFQQPTILIGRAVEALDTNGRVRRNHVVFDDRNATVSRAHATLKYDAAHARYRLLDDRSMRGTNIVRGGATIAVPRDARGVRIQSGDELHFGKAAVRVTIE